MTSSFCPVTEAAEQKPEDATNAKSPSSTDFSEEFPPNQIGVEVEKMKRTLAVAEEAGTTSGVPEKSIVAVWVVDTGSPEPAAV